MEYVLSSEESSDTDIKSLRTQLTEYGLNEDNLSKEEMTDLLKVLKFSKSAAQDEDRQKKEDIVCNASPKLKMRRRYLNVRDRRLPWSLFPNSTSAAERARLLVVYFKIMSLNNYRQARQSVNLAAWPPPLQILEETTRIQPQRSTRSGRSVPVYAGFDDDSSDVDFVITKSKKRKVSNSDHSDLNTNKGLGLKRKSGKDDNSKTTKEAKIGTNNKNDSENQRAKECIIIEDCNTYA
ncbi:unnamed protein product [Pieris macdunnoughi]|uniref:Uncharacterized protein n=1 Tax=Pieris macdunnoughi TaxID=345717 RepID=A0A821S1M8_9NEOP|nr:unnamed protein product [Pieris macdunnoughi]